MDCDVFWTAPAGAGADVAWLDAVEQARAETYARTADRQRFVVAACLLRAVAARELGVVPAAVTVDRTCPDCGAPHGRPRIAGLPGDVSVSHSGERVAVALVRGPAARIGVDVELVDPGLDVTALVGEVYAAGERSGPPPTPSELIGVWTRKEAVLKATGDGLRVPMTGVVLERDGTVRAYAGRPDLRATAVGFDVGAGYRAACAVIGDGSPRVVVREVGSLSGL